MHAHGHHAHHQHNVSEKRRLIWSLILIFGFALVEAVFGYVFHSVALLGDAGHMLSDSAALGIALLASLFASKPPSETHSFGLARLEVVAAFFNGLIMLFVVLVIAMTAVQRMVEPAPVNGVGVIVVALFGLITNVVVYKVLHHQGASLNTRAALLHVMGDLLGSVAALSAGIIIYFSGWNIVDPVLSLLICVLILISTFRLLKQVLTVLLEGVPSHLDLEKIGYAMAKVDGVESVHDLHIWSLSSGNVMLSAHVVVASLDHWPRVHSALVLRLQQGYNINHVTLQPEVQQFELKRIDTPSP